MVAKLLSRPAPLLILWCGAQLGFADDTVHPPWERFQPNTTTQEWTFPDANLPHEADHNSIYWNPNGVPFQLDTRNMGSGLTWLPTFSGRSGIYAMGPAGPGGPSILVFYIPNTQIPRPRKDIWAQITWQVGPGDPSVDLVPFGGAFPPTVIENGTDLGGGWKHSTFSFTVIPNPSEEFFQLRNNSQSTIYIDQIVLDTQCVPEPGTLLTFGGLSALALIRRRRAKA